MKLFLTVGAQLPFDRLALKIIDLSGSLDWKLKSQLGSTKIEKMPDDAVFFMSEIELEKNIEWADVIVGHAGIGTILTCVRKKKPLVIMPRKAMLGEHRNDHQLDTCNAFSEFVSSGAVIEVAYSESDLLTKIKQAYDKKADCNGAVIAGKGNGLAEWIASCYLK